MESVNEIKCPYCNYTVEPWDIIEVGDMDGDFDMECEKCGKEFGVTFKTDIKFNTTTK